MSNFPRTNPLRDVPWMSKEAKRIVSKGLEAAARWEEMEADVEEFLLYRKPFITVAAERRAKEVVPAIITAPVEQIEDSQWTYTFQEVERNGIGYGGGWLHDPFRHASSAQGITAYNLAEREIPGDFHGSGVNVSHLPKDSEGMPLFKLKPVPVGRIVYGRLLTWIDPDEETIREFWFDFQNVPDGVCEGEPL